MEPEDFAYMLGTPERIYIISALFSQKRAKVRPLSRAITVSPGLVSRYLNFLHEIDIVDRRGNEFILVENDETQSIRNVLDSCLDIVYD